MAHLAGTHPLISDLARPAPSPFLETVDTIETGHLAAPELVSAPAEVIDHAVLRALLVARLEDDKAQDIVVIDLFGKSSIADDLIIASGRSQRHVAAMADHLLRFLKETGQGRAHVEGLPQGDWVLIDAGDVIVHLFRPEVRSFYNIEKIWSVDGPGHLRDSGAAV